jgi:lipopolysaccharide biosynthesis glycosyltransferase
MIQQTATTFKLTQDVRTTSPVVLCAADESYAMPLAVTLHSAACNLSVGEHLYVVLLDGGISESSWMGIRETLAELPITIDVIRPDLKLVQDLSVSHHISHSAYLRLMADQLLPSWIDKVIYLDSDLLVLDDLCKLWKMDLGDHYCLAAVDISCPFVDAKSFVASRKTQEGSTASTEKAANKTDEASLSSVPFVNALRPIPNWRELGIDGEEHYFNSGVMVLNLKRWRAENISSRLFECLRTNSAHVWCWDQYALNVVFSGQWGKLPARWNQGTHVYEYPDENHAPIAPSQFAQMRDDPAIVHYTTEYKPWNFRPFHPERELYYRHLDQTAFAHWRPEDPGFRLGDWWTFNLVQFIRSWTVGYRKWYSFRNVSR